jgi:hypothetical protein
MKLHRTFTFLLLVVLLSLGGCANNDWHTASRDSAGIEEAVLIVFGTDTLG